MKTRHRLVLRFNDNGLGSQHHGMDFRGPGEMFLCLDAIMGTSQIRLDEIKLVNGQWVDTQPSEREEQDQLKNALRDFWCDLKTTMIFPKGGEA